MKTFAELYWSLDATTSNNAKLASLQDYFRMADNADAAWAVYFLAGGRPRQLVPTKLLRELAIRASGLSPWLFEESYQAVGDLAETISLLLPPSVHNDNDGLAKWVEVRLLPLRGLPAEEMISQLLPMLGQLDRRSQFVCIKLITGNFRVGVSKLIVTRALATLHGIDAKHIAQRLVGYFDLSARPTAEQFGRLVAPDGVCKENDRDSGHPYPFFLAQSLQIAPGDLQEKIGSPDRWQIEWKWDGIRAQLVKRHGQMWIWSRGEELVTERFPELMRLDRALPDGMVLDGEIVVWKHGRVQPFTLLQQRIGRKSLSKKILESAPVVMLVYDVLEYDNKDIRNQTLLVRRRLLEQMVKECASHELRSSPILIGANWQEFAEQRAASREFGVEGLMLKNKDGRYGVGRTKDVGAWWKWKIEPYTVDAVLIYAQPGHGRRASLFTDYTFAVWDTSGTRAGRELVPFAKAYSGLTDAELREVDAIVRQHTVEKFGPVRSVTPTLVFELGFEGIGRSGRHKSGIALRFPRMLRWRRDKTIDEADTLDSLLALLPRGVGESLALTTQTKVIL